MNINDREFRITLPKYDNSGMKIKASVVREIVDRMTDHFKGATAYPSVLGCWIEPGTDKKVCEENILITSVRDSETTKGFRKQIFKDEKFIKSLSSEVGKELGQESILYGTSRTEVSFMPGVKLKRLSKEKVGQDIFNKLI